ncbi:carbohydrate ABC transporter permease [Oceanivirga miroungae]|uniref:Binding-protein-dependent transport system inner membrane protein n=1 Tax=Oceanivirga miroungae TaxID=1130046 RepID=A0A6I8M8N2_9FUSO|nr:sugar ABC transporter permease [Oceanivirga miroungae]VWL85174.1 binding-protein-dependent transport system inner membrane protein [Oceanivirga miroungae]
MLNEFVYDSFQVQHERKNLYLLDKARGIKVDKAKHPYIIKLNKFKEEEASFIKTRNSKIKEIESSLLENDKRIKKATLRLEKAKLNKEFYEKFYDLTYDASFLLDVSKVEINMLERVLKTYKDKKDEIEVYIENLKHLDMEEEKESKEKYEIEKEKIKKEQQVEIAKLKELYDDGIISKMAYKNKIEALKIKEKDELEVLKMEIPSILIKARLKSLKYGIKQEYKNMLNILELEISDIRRRTPIEVSRVNKTLPILTFLIPGLGQFINKQYFKASLFFILTLFTYFAAIPYALGYGNYRGTGISGLITLAQGGSKLDKSMIFMIEGVIAVFLLCIVIAAYYFAYKDVKDVLNDKMKGIRPKTYFETVESLSEEGLPYIVATGAFILILFIVIVPILTTILLSFTGMDPNHQSKFPWVGLENYKLLIQAKGVAGGPFWLIIGWTLMWTLGATTLSIFVGFMLAIIANNDRIKFKGVFRTIYLLPWAVPAFITIMYFSIMVSPSGSITTFMHDRLGIDLLIKNSPAATRIFLILMQTWLGSSYVFLLSTGVLQAISEDLYEAADIDGSTAWQKLSKITVPLVLFQTAPLLIGQYTFNFNNFSIIYLFNQGGPFLPSKYGNIAGASDLLISYIYKLTINSQYQSAGASDLLISYIYKLTINSQYQSAGAAITIFISIALMIIAYVGFKNSKAFKEE